MSLFRWLALLVAISAAPGCALHRVDIQQGNVIEDKDRDRVQLGMTQRQVQFLLGTPLVVDPFHKDRWDYVYRMDKPWEPVVERRLTVFFADGKVIRIIRDVPVDQEGTDEHNEATVTDDV